MEAWRARWRLVDPADGGHGGGQGTVRKVVSVDGLTFGGLKILHSNGSTQSERRFRFQQEANSLLALEGDVGTPMLLDSNANEWRNKSVPLYLVMEWIEGPTLTQVGHQSLTDALSTFDAILHTLMRCEALGIRHRDIKPDNVKLRNGDCSMPVLLDFGLSWSSGIREDDFQTLASQELGNRFLRLPEFAPGHDQRDHRSDLTLAIGLLYFSLTGRAPRVLADAAGDLPHERQPVPEEVSRDDRWPMVRRLFQVGFQPILLNRFEGAKQVQDFIDSFRSKGPAVSEDELSRELEALQTLFKSGLGRARDQAAEILLSGSKLFLETVQNSVSQGGLACGGGGPNIIDQGLVAVGCELNFFAVRTCTSHPTAQFSHSAYVEQGRLRAIAMAEGREAETYYEGPAADREGFERAATMKGREIAIGLVRTMKAKLTAR